MKLQEVEKLVISITSSNDLGVTIMRNSWKDKQGVLGLDQHNGKKIILWKQTYCGSQYIYCLSTEDRNATDWTFCVF